MSLTREDRLAMLVEEIIATLSKHKNAATFVRELEKRKQKIDDMITAPALQRTPEPPSREMDEIVEVAREAYDTLIAPTKPPAEPGTADRYECSERFCGATFDTEQGAMGHIIDHGHQVFPVRREEGKSDG